ncbi:MAG: histidine kinase [Cellulosilyticaceae bacterium]
MTYEQNLIDIMKKTIDTLELNRKSITTIIDTLELERSKKQQELKEIKLQLPIIATELANLVSLDQQLRQKLAIASNDFTSYGEDKLKIAFEKANSVHKKLLQTQEKESSLVKYRDILELDLRHTMRHIDYAECMSEQLATSLTYLQTGIHKSDSLSRISDKSNKNKEQHHYIAFLKTIENEKLRIARDLHDGPAQQIASARMNVDFCKNIITTAPDKAIEVMEQLKLDLSDTLTEVRSILFQLNLAPLEKIGLKSALENLLFTIFDTKRVKMGFSYELTTLSDFANTTIYRIIQELLNNTHKHAEATQVVLHLSEDENTIYLQLLDNGKGFSVPKDFEMFLITQKSYGLSNISTRVKELNGVLQIYSSPTTGTLFKIQIPKISL